MFDVHCHILPMVDDGAKSLQESLEMIKLAYEDGIRGIVATPHKNHPIDFKPKSTIEESYNTINEKINQIYKDFTLVLGSELYITKNYLEILDAEGANYTINNTSYIMMEFDRNVTFEFISETVHEFIVRGYKPILAHVEMYDVLVRKITNIYKLRNQGAYIQLTGSSISGKRGNKIKDFSAKLIKKKAVDFIVTDAHGITHRRPILSESYQIVAGILGTEKADIIYKKNPRLLIAGENIVMEKIKYSEAEKHKTKTKTVILAAAIAASILIIGIGAGREYGSLPKRDIINNDTKVESKVEEEVVAQDKSEAVENKQVEVKNNDEAKVSSITKSKSEIESKYYSQLKSIEGNYVGQLEGIVSNMKYAKENITDETQLSSTLEAYKQQIFDLEAQADNQVYAILYDMQNELEEGELDISTVQAYRDEYNSTKMAKQSEYINKLGY